MRMILLLALMLPTGIAGADMNWKSVWIEPRTPLVLKIGETRTFTVVGVDSADVKAELTTSKHLEITSSDPAVLDIDHQKGALIAKKPGHVDIRITFGDTLRDMVPAFVRETTTTSSLGPSAAINGVWKAVFTGPLGDRPKMVSEIVFDLTANGGSLTGTIHASYWPGDAAITEGTIDGDRVSFTMIGHSPSGAGTPGAMVFGYPKLCFTGVRQDDGDLNLNLRQTEARRPCESGTLLPMIARRLAE